VFIRAPRVEGTGPEVEVLAEHEGDPVVVREGTLLASTFHPEIAGDARLHELLLGMTG
nr:pyridoxal 5'-phosphate synthase glutaminase subunit PdxT [Actinomycetota bacterium]